MKTRWHKITSANGPFFFLSLSQPAIQIPVAVFFFLFFKQRRNMFVVITTTAMAHISSTITGLKVYSPFANCWMSSSQHFPLGFKICSPQLNPPSATVFVSISLYIRCQCKCVKKMFKKSWEFLHSSELKFNEMKVSSLVILQKFAHTNEKQCQTSQFWKLEQKSVNWNGTRWRLPSKIKIKKWRRGKRNWKSVFP